MRHKVLIIEDSGTSMRVLKRIVGKARLTAVCANSLTEAKHIFAESRPEEFLCAVVDYTLPDAPEGQAIDFALDAFLPPIVITGRLDEAVREHVLSKEVVDYIPKENAQVYEYLSRLLARLEKNKTIGVLVVDDSRVSRNNMMALLRRHNFEPFEASDADEALAMLTRERSIKLMITDENMPGMSGVELVAEVRRSFGKDELSVIGLSSDSSSALSARFIKSGANDYLTKPYCHEEFFCRVLQNIESIEHIEAIRRAANSDYLTGLPNRRHFFSRAATALKHPGETVSLALMDLDYFKKVNDTYGHDGGDLVLKTMAKLLVAHFAEFVVARFGGEEFCVLMPGLALEGAEQRLDDFRNALANRPIEFNDNTFNVTASIGVTTVNGSLESALRQADLNLYHAKQLGRNRVESDATSPGESRRPD